MAILVTNAVQVARFANALYGIKLGSTTNAAVNADIANIGLSATVNAYYDYSFGAMTSAQVATVILGNLGLAGNEAAAAYVEGQLNAAGSAKGVAVLNMLNAFSNLESDATFGAAATAWNATIVSAQAYTASNTADAAATATTTQTFTLTTGVDTLTGTAGNDTFNASVTATSAVLGGLDSVDGGAGTDTLNIADAATAAGADFALPTGMTIKNIEAMNVTTNGSIGKGGATNFDVSTFAGLTSFVGVAAGTGSGTGSQVKAAGTTDVALTVAGTDTSTVNGGKTVAITGGGVATVTDAAGATGTTLTSVALTNVGAAGGVTSVLSGKGLTSVTLSGIAAASNTVTVTNSTVGHALTINAAGTGYTTAAATTAAATAVNDTAATSLTINTTAKSAVNASGSTAVKAVTLTGAGALNLTAMGATTTSIDGSTATGALTLNTLNAAVVALKTGTGNDKATLSATAKATVDTGAGNDSLTLGAALAAGSTVALGEGNDTIMGTTAVAASTTTLTTVIDGGDGTDAVALTLLNAGNAAQFKNFESIELAGSNGKTFDTTLISGVTEIRASSANGGTDLVTLQNVAVGAGLTVNATGQNTADLTAIQVTGASTGTTDAFTVTFAGDASATTAPTAANVNTGTLTLAGIETVNIVSGGAANTWNLVNALVDNNAKNVVITGDKNLDFTFTAQSLVGTATTLALQSIDGSGATGKLAITTGNQTGAVIGGTAADKITVGNQAMTLTGNGGADNFVVTNALYAASSNGATTAFTPSSAAVTTIVDFTVGDKITFANQGTEVFTSAKIDVNAAQNLTDALNLSAAAADTTTNGQITWFQYGGNTYVVQELGANAAVIGTNDIVVKLTGLIDLSTATYDAATDGLTRA